MAALKSFRAKTHAPETRPSATPASVAYALTNSTGDPLVAVDSGLVDTATGEKVWETANGGTYSNDKGNGPRGTPTPGPGSSASSPASSSSAPR